MDVINYIGNSDYTVTSIEGSVDDVSNVIRALKQFHKDEKITFIKHACYKGKYKRELGYIFVYLTKEYTNDFMERRYQLIRDVLDSEIKVFDTDMREQLKKYVNVKCKC